MGMNNPSTEVAIPKCHIPTEKRQLTTAFFRGFNPSENIRQIEVHFP